MNPTAPAAAAVVNGHKMSTMNCSVYKNNIDFVWIRLVKSSIKLIALSF